MPRWSILRSLGPLAVAALISFLATSPAPAIAHDTRATGATDTATTGTTDGTTDGGSDGTTDGSTDGSTGDSPPPPESPSAPPPESPSPTPPDDPPQSPPPQSPTPGQPAPPSDPVESIPPDQARLSVKAYASNAVLGPDYWTGADGTSFTITVKNTGTTTAQVDVGYTVPAGVTDTATGACQGGHCSVPSLSPGTSVPLTVAITVAPDAWLNAPLNGQLLVTATAAGVRAYAGQRPWSVVFPPGPPAPGIGLVVGNITLDARPDVPGHLRIRVSNGGSLAAATTVDLVVPDGVSTGPMPDACHDPRPLNFSTTRCTLGTLTPGAQASLSVPLLVNAQARANAPLAGLVRATLTPAGEDGRSTQASYQILVAAGQDGVTVGDAASDAPVAAGRGDAGDLDAPFVFGSHSATALPIIIGSIIVLIMAIVGLVIALRRRPVGPLPRLAGGPALRAAGIRPPGMPVARPADPVPDPVANLVAEPEPGPEPEPEPQPGTDPGPGTGGESGANPGPETGDGSGATAEGRGPGAP